MSGFSCIVLSLDIDKVSPHSGIFDRFQVSGVSPAAGRRSGPSDRRGNYMNWVSDFIFLSTAGQIIGPVFFFYIFSQLIISGTIEAGRKGAIFNLAVRYIGLS